MRDEQRIRVYEAYVEILWQQGISLLLYACPSCGAALYERRPTVAQARFTTMVQCPYCLACHHRIAHADGTVAINCGDGHQVVRQDDVAPCADPASVAEFVDTYNHTPQQQLGSAPADLWADPEEVPRG